MATLEDAISLPGLGLEDNFNSLEEMNQLMHKEAEAPQLMQQAWLEQNQQTPNLAMSLGGNTEEAERQLIDEIIKTAQPTTPDEAKIIFSRYPLLNQLYALNPQRREEMARIVSDRVKQNLTGSAQNANYYLDDLDPTRSVEGPDTLENNPDSKAWQVTKNNILRPLDRLLGTNFMDVNSDAANMTKAMEDMNRFGKDTATAVKKISTLRELQRQKAQLMGIANSATPEGIQATNDLQQIQSKIDELQSSFTDAEKTAFQAYGSDYIEAQNRYDYFSNKSKANKIRYLDDFTADMDDAEFDKQYIQTTGKMPNIMDWEYARKFIGHKFVQDFVKNPKGALSELAPWMLLGAITGVSLPIGALVTAGLTVGSGQMNIDDAMNTYFQKYGTIEGFNKLRAFVGGGLNYLCNMYGGKMMLSGVPKNLVKDFIKKATADADKTLSKMAKAAANLGNDPRVASAAAKTFALSQENALEKGFFNTLNLLQPSKLVTKTGETLSDLGTDLTKYAAGRVMPGSLAARGINTVGNTAKALGGVLDNGITRAAGKVADVMGQGALSMAIDNMTAEAATQFGNQTGFNTEDILKSGAEGLSIGALGVLGGAPMGAAIPAARAANRKLKQVRGDYSYSDKDLAQEQKYLEKAMGTKEASDHLQERITKLEEEASELNNKKQEIESKIKEGKKGYWGFRNKTKVDNLEKSINQIEGPNGILKNLKEAYTKNTKEYIKKNNLTEVDAVVDDYLSNIKEDSNNSIEDNRFNALKDLFPNMSDEEATFKSKFYKEEASQDAKDYLLNKGVSSNVQDFATNKADMDVSKFIGKDQNLLDEIDKIEQANKVSDQNKMYKQLNKDLAKRISDNEQKLANPNITAKDKQKLQQDNEFYKELQQGLKNRVRNVNQTKREAKLNRATEDIEDALTTNESDYLNKNGTHFNKAVLNGHDYTDEFKQIFQNDSTDSATPDALITGTEARLDSLAQSTKANADDVKKLYKKYRKERDDAIKLHNAMQNSSDNQIYDNKNDIINKAKGLDATTDYSIETIDFGNGKEAYIATRPKEEDNQLDTLYKALTKDGNTLQAKDIINAASANGSSTYDLNVLKKQYEDTKKAHSGIKVSWDDFLNSTSLDKQKTILNIVNNHYSSDYNKAKKKSNERIKKYKESKKNQQDQNIFYSDMYNYKGYSKTQKKVIQNRATKYFKDFEKNRMKEISQGFSEIGLDGFEKLRLEDNSLQKELTLMLNTMGFFEANNALFETPDTAFNGQQDIVDWLNSLHLNANNVAQLRKIQQFLVSKQSNVFFGQGKDGVLALRPFFQFFSAITNCLDQIQVSTGDGIILREGASEEQLSSETGRNMFNRIMPRLRAFNNRAPQVNVNTQANTTYSQLHDWDDITEDLDIIASKDIVDEFTRSIIGSILSQPMSNNKMNYHTIGSSPEFQAVWDLLDTPVSVKDPAQGRNTTKRYIDDLISRATDDDIKHFLSYTSNSQTVPFRQVFDTYSNDRGLQNKIINFLLNQKEVLYTLGYLDVQGQNHVVLNETNREQWEAIVSGAKNTAEIAFRNAANTTNLQTLFNGLQGNPTEIAAQEINMLAHMRKAGIFQDAMLGGLTRQFAYTELYRQLGNMQLTHGRHGVNIENLFTMVYPTAHNLVDVFNRDVFNPQLIRNNVIGNVALRGRNLETAILNNAGKIYLYAYLRRALTDGNGNIIVNDPTQLTPAQLASRLNTASTKAHMYYVGIPRYERFEYRDPNTVTADELDTFTDVLNANGISVDDVEQYVNTLNDVGETAIWNKHVGRISETTNNIRTFRDLLDIDLGKDTEEDRLTLARILCQYINTNQNILNATALHMRNGHATGTQVPPRRQRNTHVFDDTIANNDNNHVLRNGNAHTPNFKKETHRIKNSLITDNALDTLRALNGGEAAVQDMLNKIEEYATKARNSFALNSTRYSVTSKYESTLDGYADYYYNTIAAVSLRALPGLTSKMTEDFKEVLRARYQGTSVDVSRMIDFYENENIVDLPSIAEEMGKVVARSLGYNRQGNQTLYNAVVQETGKHCIALLHQMGIVQVGRYNPNTNTYMAATKQDDINAFKGTLLVCKITDAGMAEKTAIDNLNKYRLSNTASDNSARSILDDILGFTSNQKNPADRAGFLNNHGYLDINGNLTNQANEWNGRDQRSDEMVLDHHTLPDGTRVTLIRNEDTNQLQYTETDVNGNDTVYFFQASSIMDKNDNTTVTPLRAYQICSNMVRPPRLNVENAITMFAGITDPAVIRTIIQELERRGEADEAYVRDLVTRQHPNLGLLIDYQDPNKLQGDFAKNIITKNFQGLRSLLKTAEWMAEQHIFDNQNTNISNGYLELFYDEKNTVNNRFFVDNLILNYRENKMFRNLFDMNNLRATAFNIVANDQATEPVRNNGRIVPNEFNVKRSHFFLPLVAGLDIGWDKMRPNELNDVIDQLARSTHLVTLIKNISRDINDPTRWQQHIRTFNQQNNINYIKRKPGYDQNSVKQTKLELEFNHETVATLIKLGQVSSAHSNNNLALINQNANSLANSNFTTFADFLQAAGNRVFNYTLRAEIDGTTNGPAIRALLSILEGTDNPLDFQLATGVGISNLFTNYVDILEAGYLDTYLIAGSASLYDISKSITADQIKTMMPPEGLSILQAIYGETGSDAIISDTLTQLKEILTRDFMKYPVMYIGYSAGIAHVTAEFLKLINKQVSTDLAKCSSRITNLNDRNTSRAKVTKMVKSLILRNNGMPLNVVINGEKCTLDANLRVHGTVEGSLFDDHILDNINLTLENNAVLNNKVSSEILEPIYDCTKRAMDRGQGILQENMRATQMHAMATNAMVEYDLIDYLEKNPNVDLETALRKINEITDKYAEAFNSITHLPDNAATNMSGSDVATLKDALGKDIKYKLTSMTLIKDGKLILKNEYKGAYKEGLGAGQSPMTVHSKDSYVMTNFQEWMLRHGFGKGLPIHDAMIAQPNQLGASSNQPFYNLRFLGAQMAVERDNTLLAARNYLETRTDIDENLRKRLIGLYQDTYERTNAHTQISVIQRAIEGLTNAIQNGTPVTINQFSLDAESGYTPTIAEMQAELQAYEQLKNKANTAEYCTKKIVAIMENSNHPLSLQGMPSKINIFEKGKIKTSLIGHDIRETINNIFHRAGVQTIQVRDNQNHVLTVDADTYRQMLIDQITSDINADPMSGIYEAVAPWRQAKNPTLQRVWQDAYRGNTGRESLARLLNVDIFNNTAGTNLYNQTVTRWVNGRAQTVQLDPREVVAQIAGSLFGLAHELLDWAPTLPDGTVNQAYRNRATYNIGKDDMDNYVHRAIVQNRTKFQGRVNNFTMLDILQDAANIALGKNMSLAEKEGFANIISNLPPVNYNNDIFDSNKETIIDYSDELDWAATWEDIQQRANRDRITGTSQDNLETKRLQWLDSMEQRLLKEYGQISNTQVVFTLRSKTDLLRYHLLQKLNRAGQLGNNVTIVLKPIISNINKLAPKADLEVAFYNQLRTNINGYQNDNNKLVVNFHKATTKYSNLNLIEAISDRDVNETAIIDNASALGGKKKINVVATSNTNQSTLTEIGIKRDDLAPFITYMYYFNEVGTYMQAESQTITRDNGTQLSRYAYKNVGIKDANKLDYDSSEIDSATEAEDASAVSDANAFASKTLGDLHWLNNSIQDDNNNLGAILSADVDADLLRNRTAVGINICTDGSPIASQIHNLKLPEIKQAFSLLQSDLAKDYNEYTRGAISWKEYKKPRVYKVKDSEGIEHRYVFQMTYDNSIERGDLVDAVAERTHRSQIETVVQGSLLAAMLNTQARTSKELIDLINKAKTDDPMLSGKRFIIPRKFLHEGILEMNTMTDADKNANARYMAKVNERLAADGITNITFLHKQNLSNIGSNIIVPFNTTTGQGITYSYYSLQGLTKSIGEQFTKDIQEQKRTNIRNIIERLSQATNIFHKFKNRGQQNPGTTPDNIQFYGGYGNGNVDLSTMRSENLAGRQAFEGALNICKQSDAQRGVDTYDSEFDWFDRLMVNTSTPIQLYMDETSNTIRTSFTRMERNRETGIALREQIVLGNAQGCESQTEAMRHEYAHTVIKHMDPTARQEAQKLYNIVVNNLQLSDFADGDTVLNRNIMDAYTNENTPDKLEEFMAYAVTNQKFITAINNMENRIGKNKIKQSIVEKITNFFRLVIDKIMSFVSGSYVPKSPQEFQSIHNTVTDIFRASYKISAKFWQEAQQGIDSTSPGSKTTRLQTIRENGDPILNNLEDEDSLIVRLARNADIEEKDSTQALFDKLHGYLELKDNVFTKFADDLTSSVENASRDMNKYLQIRNISKQTIDQHRERATGLLNNVVRSILKNTDKDVREKLTDYVVRADISSLFNSTRKAPEIKKLLTDDKARAKEINRLENSIRTESTRWGNFYINASKGLASYLTTGFNPTGLAYRNAYEIASLSGSAYQMPTSFMGNLVNSIDQLTTLYAVNDLTKKDNTIYSRLTDIVLSNLCNLHNSIKDLERESVYGESDQKYHVPKGQLHGGSTSGRYDIIPESELKAYEWNGYTKVADAKLDPFYKRVAKEKYVIVQAKWKSPTPYQAGVTIMTDIFKGRTKSGLSYNGARVDKEIDFKQTKEFGDLKTYVNQRVTTLNQPNPQLLQDAPHGNLVLNFDFLGKVKGANFELNPIETDAQIKRDVKIESVLGDLYGSALERSTSETFNTHAGKAICDIYDSLPGLHSQFDWISDNSTKEEYRDYYNAMPQPVKDAARERYGDKGIPIMKKYMNTVLGYREMSANDIEATKAAYNKIVDDTSKSFLDYVKYIFHNGITGNLEEFFKWCASTGKDNIVVKGLTTSWNNLVSNFNTLGVMGVPIKKIAKYQAEGFMAMKSINAWEKQLAELEMKKMCKTYNNADAAREQAIRTNIEKSPLYPLYSRGVVVNSLADNYADKNSFIRDIVDKVVPEGTARNVIGEMALTPESNLYQALLLFASAGDTVAKYALFKHLKEEGHSDEEACRVALQTFIDYSNPLPKGIQYLDSIGLFPFAKYAFASKASILNSLTRKPTRALTFLTLNSLLTHLPNVYEGYFGTTTLLHKFNLPGELFVDSIDGLTSVRVTNTITDLL